MPTKKTKTEKQSKPRNVVDLLELGTSRRKVTSAKGANGWHRWGGEWDSDAMAQLVRSSASFRTFIFGVAAERSPAMRARKGAPKNLDAAATAFETWAKQNPRQAGSVVAGLLEEFRGNYVNPLKMHPLDVMRVVKLCAAGWQASEGPVSIAETSRLARLSPGTDNATFTAIQTLRQSARRLRGSYFRVLQDAGKMLYAINHHVLMGFYSRAGLKPWRLGASPRTVAGVEIVGIAYRIASEFDASGKPTAWDNLEHQCASLSVERTARNDAELRGGLATTPAGRLWLVVHKGKLALATDRKPKRALFLVDQRSAPDARLRNVFHPTHPETPLTGLVV